MNESEYLHGQSPDYEWTDMVRSKEYHKPKTLRLQYMAVQWEGDKWL